ncbi:hypothetical protein HNI00_02145 [Thermoleptolyngbya oregonensis NK1-22]|uniref:Uncharacterized protein n=1 Tax=Thermoleptolyngbya oregonensis NK1-22 TaxID=2547457 RepID=A0AA97B995_9CYAN|nr:hypothetical protein [Thermoleptolyngbya oregonensis]WOB42100.1 hypothetical protein HNI00_02145 [Thermoleptolyngbya oregonensis NK1-22]
MRPVLSHHNRDRPSTCGETCGAIALQAAPALQSVINRRDKSIGTSATKRDKPAQRYKAR